RLWLERISLAPHGHDEGRDAHGRRGSGGPRAARRIGAAPVERDHGRGRDGPPAAGGRDRLHATLVRQGAGGDGEVKTLLFIGGSLSLLPTLHILRHTPT